MQLSMSFMLVKVHVWLILVTGIFGNFAVSGGRFLSFWTGIPDGPDTVTIGKL